MVQGGTDHDLKEECHCLENHGENHPRNEGLWENMGEDLETPPPKHGKTIPRFYKLGSPEQSGTENSQICQKRSRKALASIRVSFTTGGHTWQERKIRRLEQAESYF